jgi:hypothetical protein
VHMPGVHVGYYCGSCCPACTGKPVAARESKRKREAEACESFDRPVA